MRFVDAFTDWMVDSVSIAPWSGSHNGYGKETYGAAVSYQCRIEESVKKVNDQNGKERVSNTTLYVNGGPFSPKDKIAAMPSSFKGVLPPTIIQVQNHSDESGFSHAEILL